MVLQAIHLALLRVHLKNTLLLDEVMSRLSHVAAALAPREQALPFSSSPRAKIGRLSFRRSWLGGRRRRFGRSRRLFDRLRNVAGNMANLEFD